MGEKEYLDALRYILDQGYEKNNRTGIPTFSLTGIKMIFDLTNNRLPLLTTKKVLWDKVLKELLWFISGKTDANILQDQKVNFWKANSTREFLDNRGLTNNRVGDLGPVYGFNWRHFGTEYIDCDTNYDGKGIDQLQQIIQTLKTDPFSRRIIMTSWDPNNISKMALPPCHLLVQFLVIPIDGELYLDCIMFQRSGDMFLGVPFNIASYAMLTYMIAYVVDMKPRKFVHFIADAHIYNNHLSAIKQQLSNPILEPPQLFFNRKVESIDDFKFEDFNVINYSSAPFIYADMAI